MHLWKFAIDLVKQYGVNYAKEEKVLWSFSNPDRYTTILFKYLHYVKSVQIRRFYAVNLRIQSEYGKIRTRKNSVFGHFSRSARIIRYSCSWYIFAFWNGNVFGYLIWETDETSTLNTVSNDIAACHFGSLTSWNNFWLISSYCYQPSG